MKREISVLLLFLSPPVGRFGAEQARNQVAPSYAGERAHDARAIGRVIPEKELPLVELLLLCSGSIDLLAGIGMDAGVIDFCGEGHGRGREVLDLFEMEIQFLGLGGQFGHVLEAASGMARNEIRYNLLAEAGAGIHSVEQVLELMEEAERRLAHKVQDGVGSMLWRHFETPRDMVGYQFLVVARVGPVYVLVARAVHAEVVADSGAYERLLHTGKGVH